MLHDLLLSFDAWLDRYGRSSFARTVLILGFLLILLLFGVTGYLLDTSRFSPDSWSYYELAGTVFDGEFYLFNTRRSYFTETYYSASFPLGYPVAIALMQRVTGSSPMASVWLNIFLTSFVWIIGIRVSIRLGLPVFTGLVLSTALVLWPPYLSEVFAGRSMPLALLCATLALAAQQSSKPMFGGLFLGVGALTRFDYLPIALLFIFGLALLGNENLRKLSRWLLGLVIGLLPWIVYSWLNFDRLWISDNSWVALSSAPAFVTDFPAHVGATILESPKEWLVRVLGNIPRLLLALKQAVFSFSPFMVLLPIALWAICRTRWKKTFRFIVALLIVGVSTVPYVLTGYMDQRYFVTWLIACSLILALLCAESIWRLMNVVLSLALISSLVSGGVYLTQASWSSYEKVQVGTLDQDGDFLDKLYECHKEKPEYTLIFSNATLGARYGAITGMKSALTPQNFRRMSDIEKTNFFNYIGPFIIINNSSELSECLNHG